MQTAPLEAGHSRWYVRINNRSSPLLDSRRGPCACSGRAKSLRLVVYAVVSGGGNLGVPGLLLHEGARLVVLLEGAGLVLLLEGLLREVGVDVARVQRGRPLLEERLEAEAPDGGAVDGGEEEEAEEGAVAGEDHEELSEAGQAEEDQVDPGHVLGGALVVVGLEVEEGGAVHDEREAVGEAAELEEDPVGLGLLVARPPLHAHVEVGVDVLHEPQHGRDEVEGDGGAEDLGAGAEAAHRLGVVRDEDLEHGDVEGAEEVERHEGGDGEVEGPRDLHALGSGVEVEDEDAVSAERPVEDEHEREGGALEGEPGAQQLRTEEADHGCVLLTPRADDLVFHDVVGLHLASVRVLHTVLVLHLSLVAVRLVGAHMGHLLHRDLRHCR
ncbi:uncharacterized protein BcabD6B2_20750 [Babesia caballi]|uniref:Uncharacterized protein n=1 Tax=Babesia caballi TaxID=5871 RepID=A0AAV4LST4_BABCB|nr:hypothetical protein, conserved [Babesia caballi]